MDPMTGLNRGYCFITFVEKDGAQEAVKQVSLMQVNGCAMRYLYQDFEKHSLCTGLVN